MTIFEWMLIGVIVALLATIGGLIALVMWIRTKDLQPEKTPTEYTEVIEQLHDEYISDVTRYLNHEHGIALTRQDVEESPLFYYTTYAMINNEGVERCAKYIVMLLDDLVQRRREAEAELEIRED